MDNERGIADQLFQAAMSANKGISDLAKVVGVFFNTLISAGLERDEAVFLTQVWLEKMMEVASGRQ